MSDINSHLKQQIEEQISLEEHLYKEIEEQLSEIPEEGFSNARGLLIETKEVLEAHFVTLNEILDQLEVEAIKVRTENPKINGVLTKNLEDQTRRERKISRILRDNYSKLNLISMSNTILYTTALALDSKTVEELALKHLANLAPLIVKLGNLLPEAVARELQINYPKIDLAVAKRALENTRQVWQKIS